ncbi:hypothetical protein LWP59_34790 [Amycolatopsis acidiphila]|uniref:Uncharacterized protein n=1 Tax=Amycolatopsis acidiphila TaxID=715473 RepID=A0A558A7Y6_9PSEU|nr:gephyrin-like molybdotransferase receptor GlpR [Amycolatopsis acidiphila]TVT20373.1 hypothetical protein FNH06_20560 [Amycolatopsis acidiphila]UIJ59165.1 hypothetical protein LWP59_34790 [Amycolatopsis acidiphila]GHG78895.1 hypothetical protein GCM10017788_46460 [Amycolatopsis acidiphila]
MPSSLIIVALAAAWLVVLVPMVARKRQAVVQTADAALAARVVRSGSGTDQGEEEFAMAQTVQQVVDPEPAELEDDLDEYADPEEDERRYRSARGGFDPQDDSEDDPRRRRSSASYDDPDDDGRRYRPGRGGFDPEAAEIAARAKYAFRQRVVLALILLALVTAGAAGFVTGLLWWAHGLIDIAFVSYLAYLRRQVRIENEIRQRRLARLDRARRRAAPRRDLRDEYEVAEEPRRELVGIERRPSPASRMRGRAVIVDVDDEDPAFHELDDPGQLPFRRAVGE